MWPWFLNPLSALRYLQKIDREAPSHKGDRSKSSETTLVVLASVCFALLVLNYCKNSAVLESFLRWVAQWQDRPAQYWLERLNQHQWGGLFRYSWWTFWHVVAYVAIPALVIKCYFRASIRDYAWRWGETHRHWRGYALLLTPIVIMVVLASFRQDFTNHYPFYRHAGRSWFDLLAWECLYLIQFACLEFFFRGYLVQSLRPHYGAAAIYIMVVPYLMIHFPKPWLEATGAIFLAFFSACLPCVQARFGVGFWCMPGSQLAWTSQPWCNNSGCR